MNIDDLCRPIGQRELAVKLEETMALWPLPDNWGSVAKFYLEAFRDVPADLVDRALRHARMNCKWAPRPSELLEPIRASIASRMRLRETYAARVQRLPEPQPITIAEREADRPIIDAAMKDILAALPTAKPVETYQSETPAAQARREALREAAARFHVDIMGESASAPAEAPA